LKYVAARIAAAAILVTVAVFLVTAVSAYAKTDPDNPNGTHDGLFDNPGHHYGQLKHHAPAPTPAPTPDPQPSSDPAPAAKPAAGDGSRSSQIPAPSMPNLAAKSPATRFAGNLRLGLAWEAGGGLDWLLLLVLPLLLAVWVMVFTRLLVTALRRTRTLRPTPQLAPANT
jgi:hypothetical protein